MRLRNLFVRNPHVASREFSGTLILVPVRFKKQITTTHFLQDPVSLRIWELLAAPHTPETIAQKITQEFDAPPGQIQKDVSRFIKEMRAMGLLCVLDSV